MADALVRALMELRMSGIRSDELPTKHFLRDSKRVYMVKFKSIILDAEGVEMFERITFDPKIMGGACLYPRDAYPSLYNRWSDSAWRNN